MKILGFNFTKINSEKISNKTEGIKLKTNLDISDIKPVKSDFLDQKEKIIGVKFVYNINYEPEFAKISLGGNILISLDQETYDKVIEEWKNKSMPEEFRLKIFNLILKKSTLKALQLEEELNIPLHMPLPSLKFPEKKE